MRTRISMSSDRMWLLCRLMDTTCHGSGQCGQRVRPTLALGTPRSTSTNANARKTHTHAHTQARAVRASRGAGDAARVCACLVAVAVRDPAQGVVHGAQPIVEQHDGIHMAPLPLRD